MTLQCNTGQPPRPAPLPDPVHDLHRAQRHRVKAENIADTDFPVTPTEQRFDYVEHILLGLNSITYYGNRVDPTEAGR